MSVYCVVKSASGAQRESGRIYPMVANYSRIRADEFLDMLERNEGINRAYAAAVLMAAAEQMCRMVKLGHSVELPYFGTFTMSMKGTATLDEQGEAGLQDARFWKLRFSPTARVRDSLRDTDFKLLSTEVQTVKDADAVPSKEICRKLTDEMGVFCAKDFQNEAQISHALTLRILAGMVEDGSLNVMRKGRMRLYSLEPENDENIHPDTGNNAGETSLDTSETSPDTGGNIDGAGETAPYTTGNSDDGNKVCPDNSALKSVVLSP